MNLQPTVLRVDHIDLDARFDVAALPALLIVAVGLLRWPLLVVLLAVAVLSPRTASRGLSVVAVGAGDSGLTGGVESAAVASADAGGASVVASAVSPIASSASAAMAAVERPMPRPTPSRGRIGVSSDGSVFRSSSMAEGPCSQSDGRISVPGSGVKRPSSRCAEPYSVSGRRLLASGGSDPRGRPGRSG